jgi:hypothetical protein
MVFTMITWDMLFNGLLDVGKTRDEIIKVLHEAAKDRHLSKEEVTYRTSQLDTLIAQRS